MLVSCTHCQNSFEHEAPPYARGASTAVCPSCGRDTPTEGDSYGMDGDLGGPSAESRVYCFNCGKSMTPREGELIPVCDECRQDRAAEAADETSRPTDDDPVADWMIRKANANVYGPFPSETIVEWIKARKILPDEEVAHIGGAWRLFSQHEEFGECFEKPTGTASAPQQEEVDFRQKNTGRIVMRAVTRVGVALAVFGALAFGVHYAIQNDSLVVSEDAVEKMVERVSDLATSGRARERSPLAEDAGKLLFALAEAHPNPEGFSMERTLRGRTLMLRDNLPNMKMAREELEQAVVLNPNNTLALAALAELYNILAYQGYGNLDLQRQSIYLLDLAEAERTFEAEVLRARAGFLIYSGNLDEGKAKVQEALSRNPTDPELHFLLGLASRGLDNVQTPDSLTHFEKALELDPGFHQVWYELARGEESAGRLRKAIAHYSKKLELDPKSALSHHRLGRIYEAVGERKKAGSHYDKAISINPNHKDSVLRRAVLSSQVDRNYKRAAGLLRGLWDGSTGEIDLRIKERKEIGAHLACALRLAGDTAGAIEIARQMLKDDKNYGPALFHLGMALIAEGRVDDALPSMNRADESDISKRERAIIKYQVGRATSSVGRPNDARDAFQSAIDFDPTYVPAHIWLAEIKREAGFAGSAGRGLLKHIAHDPLDYLRPRTLSPIFEPVGDLTSIGVKLKVAAGETFTADLYSAAGIAFFHGGDARAAADGFRTALAEDSGHTASIFYLGLMDFDSGRMLLAAKRFEEVLKIGNDPIFHVYLAETLASRDQLDAAVASYERGLGYGLKSAWAYSRLAATLAKKGDEDRARVQLAKATALDDTAVEPRRSRFQYNL
jgi:tetratricopeptide (TPR) repeat protein